MFEGIPDPDRSAANNKGRMLLGAAALLLVVAVRLLFTFGTPKQVPWIVADGKLQVHVRFIWSADYPVCDLQTDKALVVNLIREPEWSPGRKIYGFDGGSYRAGNLYLGSGKEVELALAKETAAVILTRNGKVPVMAGVSDPGAFLSALRMACKT